VAAITTDGDRLGYSSQGPGGLSPRKPDIAAFSHFDGSRVYRADGGTSAACPVAAGLVAALRTGVPALSSATLKAIVQQTATAAPGGWNTDLGYGTINGANAAAATLAHAGGKAVAAAGVNAGAGAPAFGATGSMPTRGKAWMHEELPGGAGVWGEKG
jgi:subtilisin family serine protease